jgi:hypothetical protein
MQICLIFPTGALSRSPAILAAAPFIPTREAMNCKYNFPAAKQLAILPREASDASPIGCNGTMAMIEAVAALMILTSAGISLHTPLKGYRAHAGIGAEARSVSFERRSIT